MPLEPMSDPFPATPHPVVSFDHEPLILVDEEDRFLGHESKVECHRGEGKLHRAFSVFLFDGEGRTLLQQRSAEKPLWPLTWSNSCCSHPRRGEERDQAVVRRLEEELGIAAPAEYLYKFRYHAPYYENGELKGSEHELCGVYAARLPVASGEDPLAVVRVNPTEIAALEMVTPEAMDARAADPEGGLSPWSRMEWQRLRRDFWPRLETLFREPAAASA